MYQFSVCVTTCGSNEETVNAAVASLDPDGIKRLFIFVTGSDRVPLQNKIKVSLVPTDGIPSSHTCFQQLDIGYLRYIRGSEAVDDLQDKIASDLNLSLRQYNVFTGDDRV